LTVNVDITHFREHGFQVFEGLVPRAVIEKVRGFLEIALPQTIGPARAEIGCDLFTHLCTTNIVESPFEAARLRTNASRRFKKVENAKAMIWKLLRVAEKSWRALNAPHLMKDVYDGKRFEDGVAVRTRIEPTRKAA
jgi:hypothetical protein